VNRSVGPAFQSVVERAAASGGHDARAIASDRAQGRREEGGAVGRRSARRLGGQVSGE
jgi:hypothetical protein